MFSFCSIIRVLVYDHYFETSRWFYYKNLICKIVYVDSPNQTFKLSVVKLSGINDAPAYIPSMAMLSLLINVHGV